MIIYKVTNKVNGKIYIGCTKYTKEWRFERHWARRNDKHSFARALRKYGKENFLIEEIDTAETESEMFLKEMWWIKQCNSMDINVGYNLTIGGDRGPSLRGKDHPSFGSKNERFRQLNLSRRGIKLPSSQVEKIRAAGIGRKHSEDSLSKMKNIKSELWAAENSPYKTEEYAIKMKNRPHIFEPNTAKKIICNENGTEYSSITEAAKQLGIKSISNITSQIRGKHGVKKVQGLTFKYV